MQKKNSKYGIFMSNPQTSEITQIVQNWNDGNGEAKEELLPFVNKELDIQKHFHR